MVQLQILNLVIQNKSDKILTDNQITPDFFTEYPDEIAFIVKHKEQYGNVPDRETFIEKFPNFDIIEVSESSKYLVDTIREEHLYSISVPVVQKYAELLKTDANAAAEYLKAQTQYLQPSYSIGGIDLISQSDTRYTEYQDRKNNQENWYLESGFKELDDIIHGIQRGEELLVIVARLGQGKSWVLLKMCGHVWKTGKNIGYISPEMTYNMIGYRLDTLLGHFSNRDLMHGAETLEYKGFLDELRLSQNKFVVATPKDFGRKITVSKLRNFVQQNELDLLAIDGIKYLSDERAQKNDNLTTQLTNISEDLMELSVELGIPVLVVIQANRTGVSGADEDGTPELESIRDSDGVAHNASKVLSLKQKTDGVLEIGVKKNRFGRYGMSVNYAWDIDTGTFQYINTTEKGASKRRSDSSEATNKGGKSQNPQKKNVF